MPTTTNWRAYFTDFLPSIYGQLLIEDLSDLTACFEIAVRDAADPPWRIAIENGRLVYAGHEGPTPGCCFHVDERTLLNVVGANETPQEAFFDLRIDVTGDVELGLKLSTVLEPFFRRYPFRPGDDPA